MGKAAEARETAIMALGRAEAIMAKRDAGEPGADSPEAQGRFDSEMRAYQSGMARFHQLAAVEAEARAARDSGPMIGGMAMAGFTRLDSPSPALADGIQALLGLGLDGHRSHLNAERGRDRRAHRVAVGAQARPFDHDAAVEVARPPPRLADHRHHPASELARIRPAPQLVRWREVAADVAQRGRAQKGVDDGVQEDIPVGVGVLAQLARDRHAAQHEGPPRHQAVDVPALAHAETTS